jgi:hypothetical protein
MAIFSRIIFEAVKWRVRRGLNADADSLSDMNKMGGSAEYVKTRSRIGICEGMDMIL